MTNWCEPQAWSVPSPLVVKVREKSDAVNVVTCERMSTPLRFARALSK